ncbi:MAG TPA: radical SAM protein [Actinophytocola sp.]|jgi:pyruvate-formate lyase-activating enzyme|uniref:Rv1681 family radical SAM protein n=1 Tax=Actinophytocola sp. TaxID=1872138 RepID=UPI002DF99ADF|nr:radical SAM protein [Actinophytocola sp.]
MVNPALILDLVERVGALASGATTTVPLHPGDASTVEAWCARTGNQLVRIDDSGAVVRRGRPVDPVTDRPPGTRLWLYTNFDCNLACDYCCARSSPRTPRRALGLDRVRRLAAEAAASGVSELLLTGGEPFLLPDIDELAAACTARLPTTLLTNGMLFHGTRLERLRRMDRDRLALQISLDSPTPEVHDQHRGRGTWTRALAGIHTAQSEGFRVRVAATLPFGQTADVATFHTFLDSLGISRPDQVIRALAHRGSATTGLELNTETLIPEITATADGIYWHPVGADHPDQLVTRDLFPLEAAITGVHRRFTAHRAHQTQAAQWFPCA